MLFGFKGNEILLKDKNVLLPEIANRLTAIVYLNQCAFIKQNQMHSNFVIQPISFLFIHPRPSLADVVM